MEKVDAIMDRLWSFLQEQSFELIVSVEKEEYERCRDIKEGIDEAIEKVADLLISRGSITIPREEAIERLGDLLSQNIKDWQEILEIPEERRIR